MIAIALGLLRVLWPFLLIGGLYLWADQGWHNGVARRAEKRALSAIAERDDARSTIQAIKQREAGIALLWAKAVQESEASTKRGQEARNERFDQLAGRAKTLPAGNGIRFSAGAIRVLDGAVENANAARPPESRPVATPPVSAPAEVSEQSISLFAVEAARAYADAYAHWQACVLFYDALRNANPEDTHGQD